MSAPVVGWKNLSPVRHKARSRESITAAVQELYPDAQLDVHNGDILSYTVAGHDQPRLIAMGWLDRTGTWTYAVQSRVAFDIGIRCTAVQIAGNRFRVLPVPAEQSETIRRQMRAQQKRGRRFARYSPEYHRFRPRRYRDGDNWWIEFHVRHGIERRGPYPSTYALDTDLDRVLQELAAHAPGQEND